MLRLYDYHESGNAYKVRLLLHQLELPFERVEIDILSGESRTPEYLAVNPNHRIPVLEWPDGRRLYESNAMLGYLAGGTPFLPDDAWDRAQVLQWQFFEQYSHEPFIAVVRFWHFSGLIESNQSLLQDKMQGGYHALDVVERHLTDKDFFVGGQYSIADISLYAYTHVAEEGHFDLSRYPKIRSWIARVSSEARHVSITDEVGIPVQWSQLCNDTS